MLFFGGVSVLSFCYRDLSAWWENRTDQPDTQYHFVITGSLFLWCNASISLSFCFLYVQRSEAPSELPRRRFVIICFLSVIYHLHLGIKNRSLVYGTDRTFQYVRVCHYQVIIRVLLQIPVLQNHLLLLCFYRLRLGHEYSC